MKKAEDRHAQALKEIEARGAEHWSIATPPTASPYKGMAIGDESPRARTNTKRAYLTPAKESQPSGHGRWMAGWSEDTPSRHTTLRPRELSTAAITVKLVSKARMNLTRRCERTIRFREHQHQRQTTSAASAGSTASAATSRPSPSLLLTSNPPAAIVAQR